MHEKIVEIVEIFAEVPYMDRTVALWNEIREALKVKYDKELINKLDASGFIIKWLYPEG